MLAEHTPLYKVAAREGASFREWCGWEVPHTYSNVLAEYEAGREDAALHDSTYVGRIKATGEDVLDLIHRISTNEVVSLRPGEGAPTVLTTDRGRILDLITVHNLGDQVLLLTSPQTREKVMQWIDKYTIVEDVALEDVTCTTAMLSVMGPKAAAVLTTLSPIELESFGPNQSACVTIDGTECFILRRDLVSLPRFEVVIQWDSAEKVWEELISAGVSPMGLQAYNVLRVEQGSPEYDRELGESYNPLETGLWGSISFNKGCYIGQEVIARLDTYQKLQRRLVSLSFPPHTEVQEGARLARDGREVGVVTSVAKVPTTGELIGLAYVRKEASELGTTIHLSDMEGTLTKVEATVLPFGPVE